MTHFIYENDSGARIIFGLDWYPLIGANTNRQGQQRARLMKATHYVLAGSFHGCAIGIVRIEESRKKNSHPLHSAATLFSKNYPHGAQACLMTMSEGACWLLVCHAGTVLSHTDRWYVDESQALEAIEPIRQRFPSLELHRETLSDPSNWPAWLNATLTDESVLKPVRYSRFDSQKCIYMVLALCVLGGTIGYQQFYKKNRKTNEETVNLEPLWLQSLREQSLLTAWHAYPQLKSVIDSWMTIPLLPMGWRLTKIHCESTPQQWDCVARFVRQHRLALNAHLEQVKPLGWQVEFSPLEDAAFVWHINPGVITLELDQPWMRMDWMSFLQRVSVAFEHIQIGQTVAFPLKAPLDMQGQPLPKLSIFPDWTRRTLVLKGPLRSVSSLEGFHMPVRWRRVVLNVDQQAVQSIHRSVLTLELTGDMFESKAQ